MIKKIFLLILIASTFFLFKPVLASKNTVYVFHSHTCPHCKDLISFLKTNDYNYQLFEVSEEDNANLWFKTANYFNTTPNGVPFVVIGEKYFVGYSKANSPQIIEDLVNREASDVVLQLQNTNTTPPPIPTTYKTQDQQVKENIKQLPILGEVNAKQYSLPLITLTLGAVDGFNPCAMWTLVFLIGLLLNIKSFKRRILLGSVFILVSGGVYFLFLAAWLNLFLYLQYLWYIRLIVGGFALLAGVYLFYDLKTSGPGCKTNNSRFKTVVIDNLTKVVKLQNLGLALVGISLLAVAVNSVELICSAGLPAVFTQILALNELSTLKYYLYILLYILVFMLDDLIIFIVAMLTLNLTGFTTKYAKYSKIIGAVVMLFLGFALVFKPQLLAF